jgi:hypothetical protein
MGYFLEIIFPKVYFSDSFEFELFLSILPSVGHKKSMYA